jgi:hypothetical protein
VNIFLRPSRTLRGNHIRKDFETKDKISFIVNTLPTSKYFQAEEI